MSLFVGCVKYMKNKVILTEIQTLQHEVDRKKDKTSPVIFFVLGLIFGFPLNLTANILHEHYKENFIYTYGIPGITLLLMLYFIWFVENEIDKPIHNLEKRLRELENIHKTGTAQPKK